MKEREVLRLGRKVQETINWLINESCETNGSISRLLYTQAWIDAQMCLKKLFENKGFKPYFDEIGNLFGRLEGRTSTDETILTGSHVDTVKNAGMYDGLYGIVAGFIALNYLKENYGDPIRNIEVVSFAEEEGSRFPFTFWGSKNLINRVDKNEVSHLVDVDGISFEQAIKEAGFKFKEKDCDIRKDLLSFIELHVEQGVVLETENKQIGVVEHIVGQRRYTVTVYGESNHAGTTPMKYRKDSMLATAEMVMAINELCLIHGDPLVATIGEVNLIPNTVNVIPGIVEFSIDVRHIKQSELIRFTNEMELIIKSISDKYGMISEIIMYMESEPVKMNSEIVKLIQKQCDNYKINYKTMHSGAGHDSQIVAPVIPTGMIFVPSEKGISHSPEEYTNEFDLGLGVKVLISVLYKLAYE